MTAVRDSLKRYTGLTSKIQNSDPMNSARCACFGESLFDHRNLNPAIALKKLGNGKTVRR
jgi:hypothetical protein